MILIPVKGPGYLHCLDIRFSFMTIPCVAGQRQVRHKEAREFSLNALQVEMGVIRIMFGHLAQIGSKLFGDNFNGFRL